MIFNSLLKPRRPKQFNYSYRYHDPRKEKLDDIVRKAKAEKEGKRPTEYDLRFDEKYGVEAQRRTSNIRLVIITATLAIIALLILAL